MNIGNFCRSCLTETVPEESFSLSEFAIKTEKITFRDVFEDISNFQVQPQEPHRLCEPCGCQILEMFSFRRILLQTQSILETMLSATVDHNFVPTSVSNPMTFITEQKEEQPTIDEILIDKQSIDVKQEEVIEETSDNHRLEYEIIEETIEEDDNFIVYQLPELKQRGDTQQDSTIVDKQGREQKCTFCGSQHTTHASLLRHMRLKHPQNRNVPCEYCDQKMFTEADRTYHYRTCEKIREVKSNTEYTCPQCGVVVMGANNLRKHINSSHRIRTPNTTPFICDICNKQLKNKHCLQVHMRIQHLQTQTFICGHCNESYKSSSGLKYHVAQYHTELTETFKCVICDFETKQEFLLRRHMKRHNPDKSYDCGQCNRSFASLDSLKSHTYTHTSERPFNCEVESCDKTFKSRAKLLSHVRTHQGRRYECSLCSSWYLTNTALRHHLQKLHSDYELPPPGTVLCETKAQLPKRIIRLELR